MSKIKLNDPLKSEKQRNELRDINIHRQKLQSKYGDMHTEFVFFTKESEQQNYFSNQVQNYKQLIDELKFQVHQKEEKLLCLQNQNDHLKKQSNDKDSILVEKSSARNQQCLSQKNKSTQSTNFYQRTLDFKAKEDFNAYLSPNSFKLSNSDDGDAFKFKKLDKENVTLGQIGNHNNLHQSQIQATNMKNKIQSVELSLEQISEQILLEEQTQEYLNRMELDTFKSTEKLKAENSRIQDQINSFQTKEQKINNQKLIFKKDYSCVDKELKTAQTYVNQEIQYQQSKVQEKEILFQIQNKQIKESVKLIQKYRNQIQEQEKCKARQLQQIENLEYERQQKEITKKDSELFLKNLGEIDLILKHFVNGNPENLNWEQADMSQQNFEYLFPPETPKINEFNLICNSLQRINQRRPSINIGSLRDQNSLDIQLEKQFSTASSKFQQRDPNQKKSQYFIALPQEITVPKVQQNQVVEKVNQFMKYHSLTPQQIQDKLISYYHSLIFQELTLKNRQELILFQLILQHHENFKTKDFQSQQKKGNNYCLVLSTLQTKMRTC